MALNQYEMWILIKIPETDLVLIRNLENDDTYIVICISGQLELGHIHMTLNASSWVLFL